MNAVKKIPLTRIQKLIGSLMYESKLKKPCCYLERDADIKKLNRVRKAYCKEMKTRVTTNDFFIMAIGRAVKRFGLFAGYPDASAGNLEMSKSVGVGLAVAAPHGLVVPVVRDPGDKTLAQVAEESDVLVKKARVNKLMPDDFDGANIVLSGLGMYGIDSFLAITPPASAGIVSIGRFEDELVLIDDEIQTRRAMSVSLSADMRVVNEFYAARFLADIVEQLENPETLVEKPANM